MIAQTLPTAPPCPSWCVVGHDGWQFDSGAPAKHCTGDTWEVGQSTALHLEQYTDLDETGELVVAGPDVRVDGESLSPTEVQQLVDVLHRLLAQARETQ